MSAISVWEIATKLALGKLALPTDIDTWFARARSYPRTVIADVAPALGIASTRLPGQLHRDPADRIIVALARQHGVALVTRDRQILAYDHVVTIW